MSPQDNEPLTDIPEMVPDLDDVASYQRQKQSRHKQPVERHAEPAEDDDFPVEGGSGGGISLPVFALVVAVILGWAGYLQWQLMQSQARVTSLEQRLSMTDESVNQSGVAMQVKIKDLDAVIGQIRDETLRQFRTQLDQHSAQLAALDKAQKGAQATLARNDQRDDEQQKTLDAARAQLDKVAPMAELSKRKLDEQQAALEATGEKVARLAAQQGKLESRIGTNEEWVQSINTFRVQTNRELVNIKQQLVAGKAAPAPTEPGPR